MRVVVCLFIVLAWSLSASADPSASCECPELKCDPCFQEQGVTFYSEKCGPNGARVKSCARPTCVPEDPAPAGCNLARLDKKNMQSKLNRKVASGDKPQVLEKTVTRKLAEFKKEMRGPTVGSVHTVMGAAKLRLPDGSAKPIAKGMEVHEKDQIETSLRGHVKIVFKDGNIANVKPNSKLRLEHYEMGEKKKAILNLIKGKVRSKVRTKANGNTSYFRVKTKSAVAGVRGTDFVVEHSEDDRIVTKVTTFEGKVKLSGKDSDASVDIEMGKQASFIVASNEKSEVFSDDEINDFIARGYMTPVYSLSKAELDQLQKLTEVGTPVVRHVASSPSSSDSVCSSPKGEINQCAWTCMNNPKGASRCRTDLPQVNCVRKKCDANGNWSDESRLPASFFDRCKPRGYTVAPCDY